MENKKNSAPTPAQQQAIDVNGRKVLVSAAAGSGKSFVLTRRLIKSITDTSKSYDLQKLMVVTYTKQATDDLKSKITNAIKEAVQQNPTPHLTSQLMKLASAKIGTIHSICYTIVKSHFEALNLPASIAIADENTAKALKIEVLNDFIDECFSGKFIEIPHFDVFAENFITERDDSLVTLLLKLYDKIKNCPNGFEDIKIPEINSSDDFLNSTYGEYFSRRFKIMLDYYNTLFTDALNYSKATPAYEKYIEIYAKLLNYVNTVSNALEQKKYKLLKDVIVDTLPPGKGSSPPVRKNSTQIGAYFRDEKTNHFYKDINALITSMLAFSEEDIASLAKQNEIISKQLVSFLKEFDRRYSEAKKKRSYLDFNDLEHLTLKLLYDDKDNFTEFALNYSSNLCEIYVDEYQDLNPLQNKIFQALSSKTDIFMVGDIKQSIYGFRGADPSAFKDFKKSFPSIEPGKNNYEHVTAFLSENFRSNKPILQFTNLLTDIMFYTPNNYDIYDYRISYQPEDRLKAAKNEATAKAPTVTLLNCETPSVPGGNPIEKAGLHNQAKMVAAEILKLAARGVKYSDITILMRKLSGNAEIFEEEFQKASIPINTSRGSRLSDMPEIQLALCFLNCCDNPYRDIFLAGALRSPKFGFTLGDLLKIKKSSSTSTSLFDALKSYIDTHPDFEKGNEFIRFYNQVKEFSMENTVDKILWKIYELTDFFSIIYDGKVNEESAKARRANLLILHDMAKSMTGTGKSNLYDFIESLRVLIEQNEMPDAATFSGNAVKIMSIHSSKGLEAEYCFICEASESPEFKDAENDVLLDPNVGIGIRIKDANRLVSSESPMRLAVIDKLKIEWIDELMRLFYVALTRAKTKMYICSSVNNFNASLEQANMLATHIHPYLFIRSVSLIKWIEIAIARHGIDLDLYDIRNLTAEEINLELSSLIVEKIGETAKPTNNKKIGKLIRNLYPKLTYKYPYSHTLKLPSKLTVSRLTPDILDAPQYSGDVTVDAISTYDFTKSSEDVNVAKLNELKLADISSPPTAAEKGTATHVFMQFCDFALLNKNGIDVEIQRLITKRFIPKETAALINKNAIKIFLRSELYKEMLASKELNREYRFNIKFPASDFTNENKDAYEGEFIFVQGVIDCYFYDKYGDITLIDYKTDLVPKEFLGDKASEDKFFIDRHRKQLKYYRAALKHLTGKDVKRTVIYSFSLNRCIDITF